MGKICIEEFNFFDLYLRKLLCTVMLMMMMMMIISDEEIHFVHCLPTATHIQYVYKNIDERLFIARI